MGACQAGGPEASWAMAAVFPQRLLCEAVRRPGSAFAFDDLQGATLGIGRMALIAKVSIERRIRRYGHERDGADFSIPPYYKIFADTAPAQDCRDVRSW